LGQELPLQNIHQQPKTSIQRSPDLSCAPLTSSSQCHAHAYCSQFRR